jgi:cytochrome P450
LLNRGNAWSDGADAINGIFPRGARTRSRGDREIQHQISRLRAAGTDDSIGARITARADGSDPLWTDKVVRDVIATLLIAGHETSVSAYSWAADYLLHHRREHDLLVAEASAGETDRYAQAVNNEALRLRPPFYGPWVVPYRDIAVGGYRIKKGTFVMVPPGAVHRDPAAYPEPHKFRPERFLDKAPDRYGFITFSAGRHRCPGINFFMVEANIALHRVFGRLELVPCRGPEKSRNNLAILTRPRGGVDVIVKRRRPAADVPWYRPKDDAGHEQNALMRAPVPEDFPNDGSVIVTEPTLPTGAPDVVAVCRYARDAKSTPE